jgi:hypothetical protein
VHTGFWWGNLRVRNHLEDQGVDGRVILKCIFKRWGGGMNWIVVARIGTGGGLFVNVLMNLRVAYSAGSFLTSRGPVSF